MLTLLKKTSKDRKFLKDYYTPEKIIVYSKKSDLFVAVFRKKVIVCGRLEKNKIAKVYFDTKFHKRGDGKLIMEKLESLARKRKLKKIWLESLLQSTGFHEKCGFKKIKRLYKTPTSVKMEKLLTY